MRKDLEVWKRVDLKEWSEGRMGSITAGQRTSSLRRKKVTLYELVVVVVVVNGVLACIFRYTACIIVEQK